VWSELPKFSVPLDYIVIIIELPNCIILPGYFSSVTSECIIGHLVSLLMQNISRDDGQHSVASVQICYESGSVHFSSVYCSWTSVKACIFYWKHMRLVFTIEAEYFDFLWVIRFFKWCKRRSLCNYVSTCSVNRSCLSIDLANKTQSPAYGFSQRILCRQCVELNWKSYHFTTNGVSVNLWLRKNSVPSNCSCTFCTPHTNWNTV
jgi:hypothetical protein